MIAFYKKLTEAQAGELAATQETRMERGEFTLEGRTLTFKDGEARRWTVDFLRADYGADGLEGDHISPALRRSMLKLAGEIDAHGAIGEKLTEYNLLEEITVPAGRLMLPLFSVHAIDGEDAKRLFKGHAEKRAGHVRFVIRKA